MGNFQISDTVFKQIIEYVAEKTEGVHKIYRTIVKKHGPSDGIYLYIEVIIEFGFNINDTMTKLKRKIVKEIEKLTAMNVLSMEIIVRGVNVDNK